MRRSSAVTLTLLPMLASAVVAADPGPVPDRETLSPPGLSEPLLSPPGLTPTIDECKQDPGNVRCDPAFDDDDSVTEDPAGGWTIRGGFGHYFWTSGG